MSKTFKTMWVSPSFRNGRARAVKHHGSKFVLATGTIFTEKKHPAGVLN